MAVQWYRYSEAHPPKHGDYLVLFAEGTYVKELSAKVATFLTRDETIGSLPSGINGTGEKSWLTPSLTTRSRWKKTDSIHQTAR